MLLYEKYLKFCKEHYHDSSEQFFERLAIEFNLTGFAAFDIWYAVQRSWFQPKMMDVLIDMYQNPEKYTFIPNILRHDFIWDGEKFLPDGY